MFDFLPTTIRYPISFWMAVGCIVVTAVLSVAWHSLLVILIIADLMAIGFLPWLSRKEVVWEAERLDAQATSTNTPPR